MPDPGRTRRHVGLRSSRVSVMSLSSTSLVQPWACGMCPCGAGGCRKTIFFRDDLTATGRWDSEISHARCGGSRPVAQRARGSAHHRPFRRITARRTAALALRRWIALRSSVRFGAAFGGARASSVCVEVDMVRTPTCDAARGALASPQCTLLHANPKHPMQPTPPLPAQSCPLRPSAGQFACVRRSRLASARARRVAAR